MIVRYEAITYAPDGLSPIIQQGLLRSSYQTLIDDEAELVKLSGIITERITDNAENDERLGRLRRGLAPADDVEQMRQSALAWCEETQAAADKIERLTEALHAAEVYGANLADKLALREGCDDKKHADMIQQQNESLKQQVVLGVNEINRLRKGVDLAMAQIGCGCCASVSKEEDAEWAAWRADDERGMKK